MGSLLVISSLMALVPDEVGVAKERTIVLSRRLFHVNSNIGAAVAIIFGIFAILAGVLVHGWLHLKILLVLALLGFHLRLYWRIIALENEPGTATRREFSIIHGVVSALLLAILFLVFLQPF